VQTLFGMKSGGWSGATDIQILTRKGQSWRGTRKLIFRTEGDREDAEAAGAPHVADGGAVVDDEGDAIVSDLVEEFFLDDVVRTVVSGAAHQDSRERDAMFAEPDFGVGAEFLGAPSDNNDVVIGREILDPIHNDGAGRIGVHSGEETFPILLGAVEVVQTM
jgi:hypothetical protein